jgi:glucosamine-6-phosphate deaminase
MGVATILEAREIAILATGEHKAAIVRRAVEGDVDLEVAATFLQRHPGTTFYIDPPAAVELTRVATPWLLDEVEWTEALAVRAVVWLSSRTGKAILKLTQGDYADHKLSSLVARYGSPGTVNGMVFNVLGAKIRGRSKLPHGKRVICFSPHPDDDVISMGGILHKLVENGNEITVAYMTSGNIAVFDHDVRRYVDFLERLARERGVGGAEVPAFAAAVYDWLGRKRPGDVDTRDVQDIKRIIRESEAVSGIRTLGLGPEHARFLNLPFYQTGKVRKDPVGPADVAIVRALLDEVDPDIIFVAGDLSDPHGTHRMCKEAIDLALREMDVGTDPWRQASRPPGQVGRLPPRTEVPTSRSTLPHEEQAPTHGVGAHNEMQTAGRVPRPAVWLYRGAWQEWPITDATWLVPLSQEELRLKIQAIFKHQSQKDSAPFPGQDDREFWQRVDTRNRDTAAALDQLGLAEYFAMEAYVVE